MRVRARQVNWSRIPAQVAPYTKESQTFLTVGREYEVHAIAVFSGLTNVQVIDDLGYPSWKVNWLFDVVDGSLPSDWVCNVLHDDPSLLLGPEFVARDEQAYGAMVELDADQVDRFWKRVRMLEQAVPADE
jgi:hypothetical protein